ncbi:MAG: hypothetical protein CSYNP_03335 [Syntrophus sp. SKADARSKE-3]|nr:hypothetical protein [Syntrophus sp. SKADARSKE-3]
MSPSGGGLGGGSLWRSQVEVYVPLWRGLGGGFLVYSLLIPRRITVINRYLLLILTVGMFVFPIGTSFAQEWGMVLYAKPNTLIREERSIDSIKIRGSLKGGQAVKADFLKNGWYAVFALTEEVRDESRALGYVHASRLYRAPKKEPMPDGEENLTIEVKDIRWKLEDKGKESFIIEFNRFYTPAVSAITGKAPRIVLDIVNVSAFKKEWTMIKVDGKLIKRIRGSMNNKTRACRIVLDMDPGADYSVQPIYVEKENTYILQISPAVPANHQ